MKFGIFLAAIVLCGCTTSYHKDNLNGGFSEIQLDDNVFRVSFRGNGYTSDERVIEMALLRSAQVAIDHGYSFFVIADSGHNATHSTYTTPVQTNTSATVIGAGPTVTGTSSSITTGGQTFDVRGWDIASNVIVCFKERPASGGATYNAALIMNSLGPRYGAIK